MIIVPTGLFNSTAGVFRRLVVVHGHYVHLIVIIQSSPRGSKCRVKREVIGGCVGLLGWRSWTHKDRLIYPRRPLCQSQGRTPLSAVPGTSTLRVCGAYGAPPKAEHAPPLC